MTNLFGNSVTEAGLAREDIQIESGSSFEWIRLCEVEMTDALSRPCLQSVNQEQVISRSFEQWFLAVHDPLSVQPSFQVLIDHRPCTDSPQFLKAADRIRSGPIGAGGTRR
jgi:hypothetical protein